MLPDMRTEELTQLEQRLVAAVNAGEVLDLAGDHPVTFEAMIGLRAGTAHPRRRDSRHPPRPTRHGNASRRTVPPRGRAEALSVTMTPRTGASNAVPQPMAGAAAAPPPLLRAARPRWWWAALDPDSKSIGRGERGAVVRVGVAVAPVIGVHGGEERPTGVGQERRSATAGAAAQRPRIRTSCTRSSPQPVRKMFTRHPPWPTLPTRIPAGHSP